MKIGLVAMSGVRVRDEELLNVGLTLPGFVERAKVIASLPSLGLLTLAAMVPDGVDVEYCEIADAREGAAGGGLPDSFDLVAISTYSAQAFEAYDVADWYRGRGVPVVMGGLHAGVVPDEALAHCSSVVVGEGEIGWPRVLEDFTRGGAGALRRRYEPGPEDDFDLDDAPIPRYELLDPSRYNRLTVQTTRGCPRRCEFCAGSLLLTDRFKTKPAARVAEEIRRIKQIWEHPFIELADDNTFVRRADAAELLEAIGREGVHWFTETDISIADNAAMLDAMHRAGCREVLIGLESPTVEGLSGLDRGGWKLKQFPAYEEGVRRIQSHGIAVNGCFILGLDGHDESVFDEVEAFADRTGLFDVQVTVLTPFPGTRLYERLLAESRILQPGAWDRCTLFDVNYIPTGMSPDRLRRGIIDLVRRLYAEDAVRRRRDGFFRQAGRKRGAEKVG